MRMEYVKRNNVQNVPMYVGKKQIEIVKCLGLFNLVEVRYKNEKDCFVIDSMVIKDYAIEGTVLPIGLIKKGDN